MHILGKEGYYSSSLKNLTNRFGLANLENKILLIINEMSHYKGEEPRIIKKLISGDVLEREQKYKPPVPFHPHL